MMLSTAARSICRQAHPPGLPENAYHWRSRNSSCVSSSCQYSHRPAAVRRRHNRPVCCERRPSASLNDRHSGGSISCHMKWPGRTSSSDFDGRNHLSTARMRIALEPLSESACPGLDRCLACPVIMDTPAQTARRPPQSPLRRQPRAPRERRRRPTPRAAPWRDGRNAPGHRPAETGSRPAHGPMDQCAWVCDRNTR